MTFCSSEVMICGMPARCPQSCKPVKVRMKKNKNKLYILIKVLSGWNVEGDVKIRDLLQFYHLLNAGRIASRNL